MKLITLMLTLWQVDFSLLSERLILLTDVKGVLDKKGNLLQISINKFNKLIKNGIFWWNDS